MRTQLGLHREYVFYPANGWPHKNHRLLLAAFRLMCARNPDLDVDLVFTGAMVGAGDDLLTAARRMGLQSRTHWLGYCAPDQLAAIYQGCRMMVRIPVGRADNGPDDVDAGPATMSASPDRSMLDSARGALSHATSLAHHVASRSGARP